MNEAEDTKPDTVKRPNAEIFEAELDRLVDEAEAIRLRSMQHYRTRTLAATTAWIILITAGAAGFGWFLLFAGQAQVAVSCVLISLAVSYLVHIWSEQPLADYKTLYKKEFMPQLANALGGLKFYPQRGVGANVAAKTGVLPRHQTYKAEDCFMGVYKGAKVLLSEARLYPGKRLIEPVFDGLFILLEVPQPIFKGHTILTADFEMAKHYAGQRWKKLQAVPFATPSPAAERFQMYSDQPEAAQTLAHEKLLKELAEAATVFNKSHLTAVFFRKKYVFIMIPYSNDMFEASDVHLPIRTKQHAVQCKREVEQILEIIDVFDLYQTDDKAAHSAT